MDSIPSFVRRAVGAMQSLTGSGDSAVIEKNHLGDKQAFVMIGLRRLGNIRKMVATR